MKPISRRLMLGAVALVTAAGPALAQSPPPATPMSILVYEAGPAWKASRPLSEQNLAPHLGYVAAQFRAGKVIAYGTEDSTVVRGYYVLRSGSPGDVDAFVRADPGVTSGTLVRAGVHVWQVVINGFQPKSDGQAYALLRMQPGARWAAGKPLTSQDVSAHFGYMAAQAKAGVVLAAGPDGSGREGWYVVRGDRVAVERLLADDPGIRSGVLKPVVVGWNVLNMQPAN